MDIYCEEPEDRIKLYRMFSSLLIQEPGDEQIIEAAGCLGVTLSETGDEIRGDYVQMFSNYAGQLLPYESLYNFEVTDSPRVWGKAAVAVQNFYRSAGVAIDEELEVIPDHLAVELLFMGYLIDHELSDFQHKFLKEHLGLWAPFFCDDVMEIAMSEFYQQSFAALKTFILSECETFGISVEEQ